MEIMFFPVSVRRFKAHSPHPLKSARLRSSLDSPFLFFFFLFTRFFLECTDCFCRIGLPLGLVEDMVFPPLWKKLLITLLLFGDFFLVFHIIYVSLQIENGCSIGL